MSVRKRKWKTAASVEKEAWVVDYADRNGDRRLKTFERKKDADAYAANTKVEVDKGIHVADRASVTVKVAGAGWITTAENDGLEESTLRQYRAHLRLHIEPYFGATKLTHLSAPEVRKWRDWLRSDAHKRKCSPAMVRKVMVSLGMLLADAQEQGWIVGNPVRDLSRRRKKGSRTERRHRGKLKIGVDIPTTREIKAIVHATGKKPKYRALIIVAIFTGLRASELRGLRWQDIDFDRAELHVRQRADFLNKIGPPKSAAGERTVPLPPMALNALREKKLAGPKGALDLVFSTKTGEVENLGNIVKRGLIPVQIAAGVTTDTDKKVENGEPILAAKYPGIHALRHFYASWCLNRQKDGGLGLPLKMVQQRMGHSSIVMTADVYGHLFPPGDEGNELAAAERSLMA